ncbi:hypothetical protein ABW19_dt0207544 [Dactylella cylindrospora]|nr:hypothetical protein ABW19_dt0207544 [Dactylella cylindrospora]
MTTCMDTRPDNYDHGIVEMDVFPNMYNAFDSDFYKCLCEDLAKELDFPDETDLRRISQLELFGSSWETDPYKQLLLRCLDHSLPRLRDKPVAVPRSYDASFEYINSEELDLEIPLPTNPPPSPAISAANYLLSSNADDDVYSFNLDSTSMQSMRVLGLPVEETSSGPLMFDKVHLLPPGMEDEEADLDSNYSHGGPSAAGESTKGAQRSRRQPTHRRVASTGLLATVVTGDGSITWHFKKF